MEHTAAGELEAACACEAPTVTLVVCALVLLACATALGSSHGYVMAVTCAVVAVGSVLHATLCAPSGGAFFLFVVSALFVQVAWALLLGRLRAWNRGGLCDWADEWTNHRSATFVPCYFLAIITMTIAALMALVAPDDEPNCGGNAACETGTLPNVPQRCSSTFAPKY